MTSNVGVAIDSNDVPANIGVNAFDDNAETAKSDDAGASRKREGESAYSEEDWKDWALNKFHSTEQEEPDDAIG